MHDHLPKPEHQDTPGAHTDNPVTVPAATPTGHCPPDTTAPAGDDHTDAPPCDADEHGDRTAIAVLIHVSQGDILGAALCRECATCAYASCAEIGAVFDPEYEEAWCRTHAAQFTGEETVSGPDIELIGSDRHRAVLAG